uniref:Uncharacterized protein n=1 Tax=Arundo donax TaxID=35708 RepID=A0A0A8YL02_ARUDO
MAIFASDCMIKDVWLIATPFGPPVVPDVKHIKATPLGADTGSIAVVPLTLLLM